MTLRITLLFIVFFGYHLAYTQVDCDDAVFPVFYIDDNQFHQQGDLFCLDFKVDDFESVQSFSYSISFDPTVLEYTGPTIDYGKFSTPLAYTDNFGDEGQILIIWVGDPTTLADGCAIFSVCFEAIGEPGESTTFTGISNNNLTIEILTGDGCSQDITSLEFGTVHISCNSLSANTSLCHDDNGNGSVNFSFCGGTPNYNWTLTGPSGPFSGTSDENEMQMAVGLLPGTYTLTYTDVFGVTGSENIEIRDLPGLDIVTLNEMPPDCSNIPNGEIMVTGIGGNTGLLGEYEYDYFWSTGHFTDGIRLLPNGTYSVTVEDSSGCTASTSYVLNTTPIEFEVIQIRPDTCGSALGSIEFVINGGIPFSGNEYIVSVANEVFQGFEFNGMTGGLTVSGLEVGTYEVSIEDNANLINNQGCTLDVEFEITDVQAEITTNTTVTDVSCFGDCNGMFVLDINQNGVFGFSQVLNLGTGINVDPSQVNSNSGMGLLSAEDLCPGSYEITAIDSNTSCRFDTVIVIGEPQELDLIVANVTNSTSCTNPNGQIFLSAVGGTPPLSNGYIWDPALTNTNTVLNADSGSYSITLVDANLCRDSVELFVGLDNNTEVTIDVVTPIGCNGSTMGQLVAMPSDNGDYTHEWFNTTTGFLLGTTEILDVNIGTFHVITTNVMSGCVDSDTVTMTSVNDLSFEIAITNPMCFDSLGTVEFFNVVGGQGPYSLFWQGGIGSTDIITDIIPAGTFTVTLIDDVGCVKDTMVTLTEPNRIIPSFQFDQPASCADSADGSYSISASGGTTTSGYSFEWSAPSQDEFNVTESTATNLPGGMYDVTITDEAGCSVVTEFEIESPDPILYDSDAGIEIQPACPEVCSGIITLAFTGGTPATTGPEYEVLWSDGSTDLERTNLCPDLYSVTVTDDADCTEEFSFDFSVSGTALEVRIDSLLSRSLSCISDDDGQIGLIVSGGNGDPDNYDYDWTNAVSNGSFASNLQAGFYEVTVTDVNGCSAVASYTIEASTPFIVDIPQPEMANCAGGQSSLSITSVAGGSGSPYFFQINNQEPVFPLDTVVDLFAGIYNVTIIDSLACPFDTLIEIFEPMITSVDLGGDQEFQLGQNDAELNINYTGDFPIVDVMWMMSDSFECVTPLCESVTFEVSQNQLVSVVVTDENGCTAVGDMQITVNDQRQVFLPNMILPGDPDNGIIMVYPGQGSTLINSFRIFDRWGNEVYAITDIPVSDAGLYGWDGMIQNRPAETGVYIYIADILFIDGESKVFTSDLTLIR